MAFSGLKQECSKCVWGTLLCQEEASKDSGVMLKGQRSQLERGTPTHLKCGNLASKTTTIV